MTTAARPTWAPAKGSDEQGGSRMFGPSQKFSSRDMAAHTKMKSRREGQNTRDEIRQRDLGEELEHKERKHFSAKERERELQDGRKRGVAASALIEERKDVEDRLIPKPVDADDSDADAAEDDSDDEDDDDDEDDTAALMLELERIKKERAEERVRKEKEKAEQDAKLRETEIALGNPLVTGSSSFSIKRRWDNDVVFRNQSKGEVKPIKRFINDTIRSDFHRRFLDKYMK